MQPKAPIVIKITSCTPVMAQEQSTHCYSDFEVEDLSDEEDKTEANAKLEEDPVQEVETLIDGLNWFTKL